MKKLFGVLLALCLLCSIGLAETVIDPAADRGITITPAGTNPMIDGISPTTGRKLSEIPVVDGFAGLAITGRYMPMLVQIDNAGGGVNAEGSGLGKRAPWGLDYVDVVYEAPLYKGGDTRLTFLYSDVIPTGVGPTRSARVFHAWLREEWDCGFCFYGQQEYKKTSVPEVFKQTGANSKGVLFLGTVGTNNPWKVFYFSRNDKNMIKKSGTGLAYPGFPLSAPHDKGVNAAAVSTLIPAEHKAAEHAWLFSDTLPTEGDEATEIHVNWGKKEFNSLIEWDEDEEQYYRFMVDVPKSPVYADFDSGEPITFSNVIVQFTEMEYFGTDAPCPTVTGTGNADYFIGGRHIEGVWQRDDLSSRTVFYGTDGKEITLSVGRTLIIVMDGKIANRSVSYE